MAAVTMTSSFFAGAAIATSKHDIAPRPRTLVVARANDQGSNLEMKKEEGISSGRRDLVFAAAAAAAAAYSVARAAAALDEPRKGTPEAKKYAPICVTMPTARICRK